MTINLAPGAHEMFLPGLGAALFTWTVGVVGVVILLSRAKLNGRRAGVVSLFANASLSLWSGLYFFSIGAAAVIQGAQTTRTFEGAIGDRWIAAYHMFSGSGGFAVALAIAVMATARESHHSGFTEPLQSTAARGKIAWLNSAVWLPAFALATVTTFSLTSYFMLIVDDRLVYVSAFCAGTLFIVAGTLGVRRRLVERYEKEGPASAVLMISAAAAVLLSLGSSIVIFVSLHNHSITLWRG